MSDIDEMNEFLAHHGVKGMKWGVRKAVTDTASGAASKFGSFSTKKKVGVVAGTVAGTAVVAATVPVGLLVVGGAATAAVILRKHGNTKVSDLRK